MSNLKLSNTILKTHGVLLLLLGISNAFASFMATKIEIKGPFHFLFLNPFPEVGFLQAYLLAALVGVTLIIGAKTKDFYLFDLVGIGMHLIPPFTLFLMYDHIQNVMGNSTIILSVSIHSFFILLELVAITFYFKGNKLREII